MSFSILRRQCARQYGSLAGRVRQDWSDRALRIRYTFLQVCYAGFQLGQCYLQGKQGSFIGSMRRRRLPFEHHPDLDIETMELSSLLLDGSALLKGLSVPCSIPSAAPPPCTSPGKACERLKACIGAWGTNLQLRLNQHIYKINVRACILVSMHAGMQQAGACRRAAGRQASRHVCKLYVGKLVCIYAHA